MAPRPRSAALALLTALASASLPACSAGEEGKGAKPADRSPAEVSPKTPEGPEYTHAGPGEVAALVREAKDAALSDERLLLVYVGASWCEPCRHFHGAVDDGRLDAVFPKLRLLEFDLDADRDRLAAAGYGSKMIPLFAVPAADGRASSLRLEGSVKGEAAIENIRGRLGPLLRAAEAEGLL